MTVEIATTEEKAWDLLFNRFGEVTKFNPLISHSFDYNEQAGVGCERQCNFDPEGKKFVRERITEKWENGFHIDIFYGGLPMIEKVEADVYIDKISENKTNVKFVMHYQTNLLSWEES